MIALRIEGMNCTSCAEQVGAALRQVPGVRDVRVSFPLGRAEVQVGRETPTDTLVRAVAALGYRARVDKDARS
jgi:copper chaperone CopZ